MPEFDRGCRYKSRNWLLACGGWCSYVVKSISGDDISRTLVFDSYRSANNRVVFLVIFSAVIANRKINCGDAALNDGIRVDDNASPLLVHEDGGTVVVEPIVS
jgi:hypothetical protein